MSVNRTIYSAELWYLSLAHTVPLPGLFPRAGDAAKFVFGPDIGFWSGVLMGFHSLLAGVLIFLILLAIRNRFRIR